MPHSSNDVRCDAQLFGNNKMENVTVFYFQKLQNDRCKPLVAGFWFIVSQKDLVKLTFRYELLIILHFESKAGQSFGLGFVGCGTFRAAI